MTKTSPVEALREILEGGHLTRDRIVAIARAALPTAKAQEAALQKFAVHGIPRLDPTPTRIVDPHCVPCENWWQVYLDQANENVKQDARQALGQEIDLDDELEKALGRDGLTLRQEKGE